VTSDSSLGKNSKTPQTQEDSAETKISDRGKDKDVRSNISWVQLAPPPKLIPFDKRTELISASRRTKTKGTVSR
jgi:hypothetical protein